MAEVSGIFPNMIGAVETSASKTATEINTKTQGQMIRLAMLVDTINQDLIIPNVEKVAKLCADFKSGIETVFVNHENQQEVIEVDDFVRQGDYKYMYSDSSMTTQKSQQADIVIQAVERFASLIPLNLQEIFVWYFEQKGVDNPERFLSGVNVSLAGSQNTMPNVAGVGVNGVNLPLVGSQNTMPNVGAGAGAGVNNLLAGSQNTLPGAGGVNVPLAGNQNSKLNVGENSPAGEAQNALVNNNPAAVQNMNRAGFSSRKLLQLLGILLTNPKVRKFIKNNEEKINK